ncbi:MAG: nodulation protein NfeD [Deltaproteobacteria bacterium]|nr:nodulation protein NfeD [Deltaproteobacteria bacterium]
MRTSLIHVSFLAALSALPAAPLAGPVHRVVLHGPVDAIHTEYVIRAIDQAESEGSELVLLELDTPGGLVDAMEEIVQRMLKSRVPTCAYVFPPGGRAASAGFFLLQTADVAAMAPGTRTGSAHPVLAIGGIIPLPEEPGEEKDQGKEGNGAGTGTGTGTGKTDGKAEARRRPAEFTIMTKVREDAQAYLRAIVERRGRNVEAAELAVTESRSYTDQEALDRNLVDLVATGEWDLLARLEGREVKLIDGTVRTLRTRDAPIVTVEMTFRERALAFLTNPNVAFLLFLVGALLIYVEVTHAGLVLPGVVGGICLLLAVMGFSFLPINAVGVLLLIAAVGLFVAEAFVSAFGMLGVAGVVCLALGGIMLVDLPEEGLSVDPYLAVGAAVGFGLVAVFLAALAARVLRRRAVTGAEGMAGAVGEAVTDLTPRGKVFVGGEYWDAIAARPIGKGARVRATGLNGLVLTVEEAVSAPVEEGT